MKKIGIRCKLCKEILVNGHRHDFVSCKCGIFIDGGDEYLRIGGWGGTNKESPTFNKTKEECIEFVEIAEK